MQHAFVILTCTHCVSSADSNLEERKLKIVSMDGTKSCNGSRTHSEITNEQQEVTSKSCQISSQEPRDLNSARTDYLHWEDYFMALAFLAAKRSKDPCTQVGACIVDKYNKVVGLGYNGFPIGCSDEEFPWRKGGKTDLDSKYMYVCHAEMNAILNKITADVTGCTMFVALFPCAECAKIIIQSRISTVVYMSDKHASKNETIASKRMLDAAGIKYRRHTPREKKIVIDFDDIDWSGMSQVPQSPIKN
ncbi:deoxycytidylate deaminase isoform X1 [Cloeon dipterum]|uniref:deoxycytidylate deaminase isoform X1 n=2 Tax=Cloeon dipterum TaxID=197152 RepID=UPI00321F912C